MPAYRDLTGQTFDRLTAIKDVGRSKEGKSIWQCRCSCGKEIEIIGSYIIRGRTQSCGCLIRDINKQRATTHGYTRGDKITRTYRSHQDMINRCTNVKNKSYKDYGGRGIKVCFAWLESFENFLSDMGERPEGMTLDRINVNGNYEPSNCRWATRKQQNRNRTNNHILTFNGQTLCISEWAEKLGFSHSTINQRLKRGWSVERALTTPVKK